MVRLLLILCLCCGVPLSAAAYDAGPVQAVSIQLDSWHDAARNRDIPLKFYLPAGKGPFPVVLFSHGLGGSREGGPLWGSDWAAHGLLAIHLQHPGSDKAVWQDVGQAGRLQALKAAANASQLRARVEDVRFVLDELARRQAKGDALARLADLNRVGMSGHSFGAVTTQALAGQHYPLLGSRFAEPRLKAFLAFSPSARRDPAASFGKIVAPFLSITGTDDADPLGTGLQADDRQKPYAAMPAGGKYLLVLDGRNHMFFNGDHPAAAGSVEARQQALVQAVSLAFWRAWLMEDAKAKQWLGSDAVAQASTGLGSWQAK